MSTQTGSSKKKKFVDPFQGYRGRFKEFFYYSPCNLHNFHFRILNSGELFEKPMCIDTHYTTNSKRVRVLLRTYILKGVMLICCCFFVY